MGWISFPCLGSGLQDPSGVPDFPKRPFSGSAHSVTSVLLLSFLPQGKLVELLSREDEVVMWYPQSVWNWRSVRSPARSPHFNCGIQNLYFLCGMWEADGVTAFPRVHSWNCQCLRLLFDPGCGSFASCSHWKVGMEPRSLHRPGPGLPQTTAKGKQGCRYLWFGFLCVLWIAKIWPFPLQSWILSQILWISHRTGFSQQSGWLPEPWQWGKAQNSPHCVQSSLGLPLPGTGQLFHTKSCTGISLSCLWLPQNINTPQLGGNVSVMTAAQELLRQPWKHLFQCFGNCNSYLVPLICFLWWFPKVWVWADEVWLCLAVYQDPW